MQPFSLGTSGGSSSLCILVGIHLGGTFEEEAVRELKNLNLKHYFILKVHNHVSLLWTTTTKHVNESRSQLGLFGLRPQAEELGGRFEECSSGALGFPVSLTSTRNSQGQEEMIMFSQHFMRIFLKLKVAFLFSLEKNLYAFH